MTPQPESGPILVPLLPLRGETLQPGVDKRFFIGRLESQKAIRAAAAAVQPVFFITQKDASSDLKTLEDLYRIGTVAELRSQMSLSGNLLLVQVTGQWRARLLELIAADGYQTALVEAVPDDDDHSQDMGPPPVPVRPPVEAPDDIVECIDDFHGFDPIGDPCIERERNGGLWLLFEQMPPSWVPEPEYAHFGRCARFDQELQQAIEVDVLWDDRERFYIEHPKADTVARIREFLVDFRARNEPRG